MIAPSYRLGDRECLRRGFEHEASPDWRGGGCRTNLVGTRLGAPASPSGGNAVGLPGPNPGGPGLTPYSTGPARPAAAPAAMAPAPTAAMPPPSSMSETSSAMPPKHHYSHHTSHGKMAGHHYGKGKGPKLTGSTANQLNQEELARLQAGNYSNPAAPPPRGAVPPPRGAGRNPLGGPKTD